MWGLIKVILFHTILEQKDLIDRVSSNCIRDELHWMWWIRTNIFSIISWTIGKANLNWPLRLEKLDVWSHMEKNSIGFEMVKRREVPIRWTNDTCSQPKNLKHSCKTFSTCRNKTSTECIAYPRSFPLVPKTQPWASITSLNSVRSTNKSWTRIVMIL